MCTLQEFRDSREHGCENHPLVCTSRKEGVSEKSNESGQKSTGKMKIKYENMSMTTMNICVRRFQSPIDRVYSKHTWL